MLRYVLPALLLALPAAAQTPVPPTDYAIKLPGVAWDKIGEALQESMKLRSDVFAELARQIREQQPAPTPAPADAKPQ